MKNLSLFFFLFSFSLSFSFPCFALEEKFAEHAIETSLALIKKGKEVRQFCKKPENLLRQECAIYYKATQVFEGYYSYNVFLGQKMNPKNYNGYLQNGIHKTTSDWKRSMANIEGFEDLMDEYWDLVKNDECREFEKGGFLNCVSFVFCIVSRSLKKTLPYSKEFFHLSQAVVDSIAIPHLRNEVITEELNILEEKSSKRQKVFKDYLSWLPSSLRKLDRYQGHFCTLQVIDLRVRGPNGLVAGDILRRYNEKTKKNESHMILYKSPREKGGIKVFHAYTPTAGVREDYYSEVHLEKYPIIALRINLDFYQQWALEEEKNNFTSTKARDKAYKEFCKKYANL